MWPFILNKHAAMPAGNSDNTGGCMWPFVLNKHAAMPAGNTDNRVFVAALWH